MSELTASPCPACGADPGSLPDNQLYLPPGITLNNRYLIGKVIGVGGFGVVYLGWDTNLDVRVAVKEFLPKDIAGRSNDHVSLIPYANKGTDDLQYGIQKFLEEAKALARFQDHPGIVKVSESFKANNTAYMVMQYLDGMTLKEYLKRQPGERMLYDVAVKTLTPIMDALREVHKAGFVHRDISPDNIFITRQKQVKLLDFGAARYAMGEHSKSLTSILKHGYAPMEQYSTKGNQGPWTDVYAVAATLYRCITGETPPDAMERVQEECIRTPRQMGITIPLSAELALMQGLALKAAGRFESVEMLQSAFQTDSGVLQETPIKLIRPQRPITPGFIECPECGAKNQLDPDDDPNALRCGRCKWELGVKPVPKNVVKKPIAFVDNGGHLQFNEFAALDNVTGLIWIKDKKVFETKLGWAEAMEWVKRLTYIGYSDWRLPTREELEAFSKRGGTHPAQWFNTNGFSSVQAKGYWSSSNYSEDSAWVIYMDDGYLNYVSKGADYYVWPVRNSR